MAHDMRKTRHAMLLGTILVLLLVPAGLAYTIEGQTLVNDNGQLQQLSCLTNAGEVKGFTWYYKLSGFDQWIFAAHTESGVRGSLRYLQSWATDFPSQGYIEFFSIDGQKKVTQTYVDGLTLNQSDLTAWKCVYGNKVSGTDYTYENKGEYVFKMKDEYSYEHARAEVTYDEQNERYLCTLTGVDSRVNPHYVWKENANRDVGSNSRFLSESYVTPRNYYYCYVYDDRNNDGDIRNDPKIASGVIWAVPKIHDLQAYQLELYDTVIEGFRQWINLGTYDVQAGRLLSDVRVTVLDNGQAAAPTTLSKANGFAQIIYRPQDPGVHNVKVRLSKDGYNSASYTRSYKVYQKDCEFRNAEVSDGNTRTDTFYRADTVQISFSVFCDHLHNGLGGEASEDDLDLTVSLSAGQRYDLSGGWDSASKRYVYSMRIPDTRDVLTKYHPGTSLVNIAINKKSEFAAGGQYEHAITIKNRDPKVIEKDFSVSEGSRLRFFVQVDDEDQSNTGLTIEALSLPHGATYDAQRNEFLWVPGYDLATQSRDATFEARFRATDQDGGTGVGTMTITVVDTPRDVVVRIIEPVRNEEFFVGEEVTFDSETQNPDHLPVSYAWNFGDGDRKTTSNGDATHRYLRAGDYTATLAYTYLGLTDTIAVDITIIDPSCTITIVDPAGAQVFVSETTTFRANASCNVAIDRVVWDFGDGAVAFGKNVAHTYTQAGQVFVRTEVYASGSRLAQATKTLQVISRQNCYRIRTLRTYDDAGFQHEEDTFLRLETLFASFSVENVCTHVPVDIDAAVEQVQLDGLFMNRLAPGHYAVSIPASSDVSASHAVEVKLRDTFGSNVARRSVTINNNVPAPVITSPIGGAQVTRGSALGISGTGNDLEDPESALFFVWSIDASQVSTARAFTYDTSGLSTGTHVVSLEVTDRDGDSAGAAPIQITILPAVNTNTAPQVTITQPADNSVFLLTQTVTLDAQVTDADGNYDGQLVWTVDGQIVSDSFTASDIGAGNHVVRATATDADGAQGHDEITILIWELPSENHAPEVTITQPSDGGVFLVNETVSLQATVTDADGNYGGQLVWTVDGQIVSDSFTASDIGAGSHVVRATATDADGAQGYDEITILIWELPSENHAPEVTITQPADNSVFLVNETVSLQATVTDADGNYGGQLVWTVDGQIVSDSFTASDIGVGSHVVRATATDADGAQGYDEITISIQNLPAVNQPPVIHAVISPADGDRIAMNGSLLYAVNATDDRDTPSQLTYELELAGQTAIYILTTPNDQNLTYNIPAGNYTALVRVTDTEGASAEADIGIIEVFLEEVPVAPFPVAKITLEQCGLNSSRISFDAGQSHDQDQAGTAPQIRSYVWTIEQATANSSVVTVQTSITNGFLAYTLNVTDNDGQSAQMSGNYKVDCSGYVPPCVGECALEENDASLVLPVKFKQVRVPSVTYAGEYMRVYVSLESEFEAKKNTLEDVRIRVSIPAMGVFRQQIFDLDPQETEDFAFYLPIRSTARGFFTVQVTLDHENAKREVYRSIYVG